MSERPFRAERAIVLHSPALADSAAIAADASHAAIFELREGAFRWPAEPADLVVLADVLRRVESPTRLLDEAVAALRAGGKLVLIEPARPAGGQPAFQPLQLGSLIQGYGLVDLGFELDEAAPLRRVWGSRPT